MPRKDRLKHVYMVNDIEIHIKKNNKTQFIRLKIDLIKKTPVLIVPSKCPQKYIQSFLKESHNSIIEKFKELSKTINATDSILFKGQTFGISQASKQLNQARFIINEPDRTIQVSCDKEQTTRELSNHLKKIALSHFKEKCTSFANTLGISVKSIKVRDYKTRWGSCSGDGTLTFSWRLIMAPPTVIDYVCAHETAHLIHFNHSKSFWKTVETLTPSYKDSHLWLKKNGHVLYQHL